MIGCTLKGTPFIFSSFFMTTRFVGIKEFRQNMSSFALRARKNNERLVILRNSEPLFELWPLSKRDATLERLLEDVEESRREIMAGRGKVLRSLEDLR